MIGLICAWAGLLTVYLVLAGQVSADEVVAGALCAAAAVLWWMGASRASAHTFSFHFDSWAAAGRASRKLPAATLSVAAVLLQSLVRPRKGEVTRSVYAHGRQADPDDGGRRAVGVLAASLAPDSFVLRTPAGRDEILVHALPASDPPKDSRWPI